MKKIEHSITFCQQAKGRLRQAKKTLKHNIKTIQEYNQRLTTKAYQDIQKVTHRKNHTFSYNFVLVDWNCPEKLSKWVLKKFSKEIRSGLIALLHIKNTHDYHIPTAKNVSHRLGIYQKGTYLINLDIDNYIDSTELPDIEISVINNSGCFFFSGDYTDGTYGRIGLPATLFKQLDGYNENLPPAGVHDANLIKRISDSKTPLYHFSPRKSPLKNSKKETIRYTDFTTVEEYMESTRSLAFAKDFPLHTEMRSFTGTLYSFTEEKEVKI